MPQAKKAEKKQESLSEFVARMNMPKAKANGNKRVSTQKKRRAR